MADSESLILLRSIDTNLKQLVRLMTVSKPREIAPDSDLDSQYGDPEVKVKDPRDWTGPTQKGKRFSECSSEYLELVASRLDFFAEKAEQEGKLASNGKPEAPYRRRDAARARGWAQRIRGGWAPRANGNSNAHEPAAHPADTWSSSDAMQSQWEGEPVGSDDIKW